MHINNLELENSKIIKDISKEKKHNNINLFKKEIGNMLYTIIEKEEHSNIVYLVNCNYRPYFCFNNNESIDLFTIKSNIFC